MTRAICRARRRRYRWSRDPASVETWGARSAPYPQLPGFGFSQTCSAARGFARVCEGFFKPSQTALLFVLLLLPTPLRGLRGFRAPRYIENFSRKPAPRPPTSHVRARRLNPRNPRSACVTDWNTGGFSAARVENDPRKPSQTLAFLAGLPTRSGFCEGSAPLRTRQTGGPGAAERGEGRTKIPLIDALKVRPDRVARNCTRSCIDRTPYQDRAGRWRLISLEVSPAAATRFPLSGEQKKS